MINVITAAQGKLDNPLMLEWAIYYYSGLPKSAESRRAEIEDTWFHELMLAQLIDSDDTSLLHSLLRAFPARRLTGLSHLLVKHWSTWPASLAATVSEILLEIAPEEMLRLYGEAIEHLPQANNDELFKLVAVDKLLRDADNPQHRELAEELAQAVLAWPDRFSQSMLLGTLLKLSRLLSRGTLASLLEAGLKYQTDPERRQSLWEALFSGLFGGHNFFSEVVDWGKFDSPLRFAQLRPFFRDEAPLEQFDQWLAKSPKLESVLAYLQTLSEQCDACQTVLAFIRDTPATKGRLPKLLQTQLAITACIQGYAKDELDVSSLSLADTLDLLAVDIAKPRWQTVLTAHLKQFDPAEVNTGLIERLQANIHHYGAVHIADVMAEFKSPQFVAVLIDAIREDKGDFLCESAQKALIEIGPEAQVALIDRWDQLDGSQQIYGVSIIEAIGGQVAADFVVTRFAEFLQDDMERACELAVALPDSRLLDLLKAELRRKQALIDRAFCILAWLFDHQDAELEGAETRAMAEYQRSKQLRQSWSAGALPRFDYLLLDLECPACGEVNRYKAKGAIVSEGDSRETTCLLADELPCASCGAEVEFKFTSEAIVAVTAELLKLQLSDYADDTARPLVRKLNCRLDGTVMPVASGIASVRSRLTLQPDSAKDWLTLGNLLSPLNRPKAALEAYRKAAQFAPMAIDAQFVLADALTSSDQLDEAFTVLHSMLEHKPQWMFLSAFPDFSHTFADLYNYLRRQLGKNTLPLLHASALNPPKKPGRNDPCSCGSGKKYKKCCGQ